MIELLYYMLVMKHIVYMSFHYFTSNISSFSIQFISQYKSNNKHQTSNIKPFLELAVLKIKFANF